MLQSENVTLSDFFGFWTSIRIKASKNQDDFSGNLLTEMNEYQNRLFENPALAAALYLDPRYQRALKGDQEIAIRFLRILHRKIQEVESPVVVAAELPNFIDDQHDESLGELEDYLKACGAVTNPGRRSQNVNNSEIMITEKLHAFGGVEEPLTTPVLAYWEKKKRNRFQNFTNWLLWCMQSHPHNQQ